MNLNVKAFSLSLGLMWSVGILFLSLLSLVTDSYGHNIVEFLSSVYIGYSVTPMGIPIGMIYAFIDASVGGLVFSWLYNKFSPYFDQS